MRTVKRYTLLVVVVLVAQVVARRCQGQGGTYSTISGEFFSRSGDSNMPIHMRGLGPNERYQMGAGVQVETRVVELYAEGRVRGSAMYDNFETTELRFGAGYKILSNLVVGLHFFDYYSHNRTPVSDPAARHPLSSINQTWIGVRYDTKLRDKPLSVEYWRGVRGNLPLYSPEHFTKPYASHRFAASYRHPLPKGFAIRVAPSLYTISQFNKARGVLEVEFEKPVWKGRVVLTGLGTTDFKLGVHRETHFTGTPLRKYSRGVFVGIKIPFHYQEQ